ncbi:MAG: sugar phosphate isomerase/epimerase family protein [bacterium]|nr:sugar phosphate isomerase/epimerase family protein [bacterium]
MYICMHNWMRPEPIEHTIQRLSRLGYDGIQIMGEPRKYDWKAVRKLLDDHNLKCFGSVSIMLAGRDLIHADPYYREMTIQYLKECLDMVAALGGNMFTLVPSEVGKVVAMADKDTEWGWAVEGVREVARHAQKHGIRIGLEPLNRFETNFLNRHDQALKLAEDVNESNVGVCLDAFHINIEEADPHQAILNTGKHLVDFHVADNNRRAPGEGTWDWKRLIETLKQAGYTEGPLTVEFVVPFDRSPLAEKMEEAGTEATEAELKFIRDHGSDLMSDAAYSRHVENTIKHLRACGA